jgi:hypothetical protein
MSGRKPLSRLRLTSGVWPADPPSDATMEKFQREYPSIKQMPSVVLAARISQQICAQPRTPSDITVILTEAIDAIRQEYRAEGEISEKFCSGCQVMTVWRVELLRHLGLIERCTVCGKVLL